MNKTEWGFGLFASALLYFGLFWNVYGDNPATSALLGWLAGVWSVMLFLIFIEGDKD